ncbi:hotdog fold thioesterase [Gulosibacter chungangensis]|uniref:Hotdog fold thioesterase n=1 Tax=Gulosibacter chungangensis TaxID=979746 RepID=A0A7J5BF08_9MICO|nr:hotdog fold thioesterase [Gulosibacter chungangensis]
MAERDLAQHHPVLKDDFASQWMGIRVNKAQYGDVEIQMELRQEMLNGFAMAHGGMVFAFADSAFAMACNDPTDTEHITVASGVDVNFLRSARAGQTLTARARAVHQGRSGLYDIEVTAQDSKGSQPELILVFRGRSRTIPRPKTD